MIIGRPNGRRFAAEFFPTMNASDRASVVVVTGKARTDVTEVDLSRVSYYLETAASSSTMISCGRYLCEQAGMSLPLDIGSLVASISVSADGTMEIDLSGTAPFTRPADHDTVLVGITRSESNNRATSDILAVLIQLSDEDLGIPAGTRSIQLNKIKMTGVF